MPLLAWSLNVAYLLLLVVASPILLWRRFRHGKYRDGFAPKFCGMLPATAAGERVIWFHAVSVGEVLQLETIVQPFASQHPDATILITSTTNTGLDVARQRFPQHRCCYFPLDFSWAVKRALKRVRPEMVVLVELELWPNFILHAARTTKVAIINGRMSDRSFRGYQRIRLLVEPVLRSLHAVGAQTAEYAKRLQDLGAQSVVVTGSIKFDRVQTDRNNTATAAMRTQFRIEPSDVVLVAGSTQQPEEELAVRAWQELRRDFPTLRLIVVPRHKERFERVAKTLTSMNVPVICKSTLGEHPVDAKICARDTVVLLDTLGELSDCWGLADIAFVGGSFGDRGGQNMIEPAAYAAAVVVGPNTSNFSDVVAKLISRNAIVVVPHTDRFTHELRLLLLDEPLRTQTGDAARQAVLSEAGASQQTLEILECLYKPVVTAQNAASAA